MKFLLENYTTMALEESRINYYSPIEKTEKKLYLWFCHDSELENVKSKEVLLDLLSFVVFIIQE